MYSNNYVVRVTGINPYARLEQLYSFFRQFTPNVENIFTEASFDGSQLARVYCVTHVAAWDIISGINYRAFDGLVMRAILETKETYEARNNIKANIFMYFNRDKMMPTERELFCEMLNFGQVVSVKVIEEKRIAFCQFYNSNDAARACSVPHFGGVRASPKSLPKNKNKNKNKKKLQKEENKSRVFNLLEDANKISPKGNMIKRQCSTNSAL